MDGISKIRTVNFSQLFISKSENSIYVVLELLEGKTLLETIQEKKGEHFTS